MIRVSRIFLEIEVDDPWTTHKDHEDYERRWRENADILIREINRHCDNVGNIGIEAEYECGFCGDFEDYSMGIPDCCAEAQNEWRKEEERKNAKPS